MSRREVSVEGLKWAYGEPSLPAPPKPVMQDLGLQGRHWYEICDRYSNISLNIENERRRGNSEAMPILWDTDNPPDGVQVWRKKNGTVMLNITGLVVRYIIQCLYRQYGEGMDVVGPNSFRAYEPTAYGGNPLKMQISSTALLLREKANQTGMLAGIEHRYGPTREFEWKKRKYHAPEWCECIVMKRYGDRIVPYGGPRMFFNNFLIEPGMVGGRFPDQMFSLRAERAALKKAFTSFNEPEVDMPGEAEREVAETIESAITGDTVESDETADESDPETGEVTVSAPANQEPPPSKNSNGLWDNFGADAVEANGGNEANGAAPEKREQGGQGTLTSIAGF